MAYSTDDEYPQFVAVEIAEAAPASSVARVVVNSDGAVLGYKSRTESFAIEFDFSAGLSTITDCEVNDVELGEYAASTTVLVGSPHVVSGAKVRIYVAGGTSGNDYAITVIATDGVERYDLTATLPVR